MTDPTPTRDEAVLTGIQISGRTLYKLDERGVNIWSANFQPNSGYSEIEADKAAQAVAKIVFRALASAPAPASGGVDAVAQLAEIEAMLSDGQGDDDGPQILPDFEPGWSTVAKVEACLHLLEKRRDALVGAPQPHANMTVSALARARDVMSAVADKVEHQGLTVQAQILRRQADDIRGTLDVLIRSEERA